MAGYGDDEGFATWLAENGYTLPDGAPLPVVLRQRGSAYLDATYGPRFVGVPTDPEQEREWPRTGATIFGTALVSRRRRATHLVSHGPQCRSGVHRQILRVRLYLSDDRVIHCFSCDARVVKTFGAMCGQAIVGVVRGVVVDHVVHGSPDKTRIIDDQREAIRTALAEGLTQGQNPRQTALDVVGRVSRASNRREGGVIGLTRAQSEYIARARQELLSGEPDQLQRYLERGRRDKRFDRTVLASIRSEKPIPRETVDRIVGRYSDRLLELRGEMLARTETMAALGKSRNDAIRQQIAAGKIMVEDVTKVWRSAGDSGVRHTHRVLNGKTAPMDGFFASPSGAMLRYPGDPWAPGSEIVGCRCWMEYKIDYFASVVRRQRAA